MSNVQPANTALRSLATKVAGGKTPDYAVALFPQGGKVLVRLAKFGPRDELDLLEERNCAVGQVADVINSFGKGDISCFKYTPLEGNECSWVWVNPKDLLPAVHQEIFRTIV
jgi:hypothetical protein